MASESREEPGVAVDLPPELDEWLEDRASRLGVDPAELVVQLLASYRTAADLDGQIDPTEFFSLDADPVDDERLEEAVERAVRDALDERADDITADVTEEVTTEVREAVDADLTVLEADFQEKIEDVRERVIQVKRETDDKAPKGHDHAELARIDDLAATIDEVESAVEDVADDLAAHRDAVGDQIDDVESRQGDLAEDLDDAQEKLRRVAWVVSDLKEETAGRDAHDRAVERIKRAAAQENVASADCERCGEAVQIALLTDPECPHCQATVSDVRPEGGFFRTKARLVAAAQLESGEDPEDASPER